MALALRRASELKPEIRLAQAISQFEASLSDRAKADFKSLKSQAQNSTPGIQDVMIVTAEMNKRTPKAAIGPRFTNMLMAVQQFATIGDVIIGGSQNLPACGVWCVVRTSLVVTLFCSLLTGSVSVDLSTALNRIFFTSREVLVALHGNRTVFPTISRSGIAVFLLRQD